MRHAAQRILAFTAAAAIATTAMTGGSHAAKPSSHSITLPGKWDSCRTVNWKLNLNGVHPRERKNLTRVFTEASRYTGITFRYAGPTRHIPLRTNRTRTVDPTADITIAFAAPGRRPKQAPTFLAGSHVGLGGSGYEIAGASSVLFDGAMLLDSSFIKKASTRERINLYLHELGHVIGLGHVDDPRQIMYPTVTNRTTYQPGDITGLTKQGHFRKPCTAQPPRPHDRIDVDTTPSGNLTVTWDHNPTGWSDPAGASQPATTRYDITVRHRYALTWEGDYLSRTIQLTHTPTPGHTSHTLNLGPADTYTGAITITITPISSAGPAPCNDGTCTITADIGDMPIANP